MTLFAQTQTTNKIPVSGNTKGTLVQGPGMGCSASNSANILEPSPDSPHKFPVQRNNNTNERNINELENEDVELSSKKAIHGPRGDIKTPTSHEIFEDKENSKNVSNDNGRKSSTDAPRAVAFQIELEGDGLVKKPPPKRFQKLAPLPVPKLTAEMLEEKQRQAEEKRDKERQKVISASRKSSKRRRELQAAKEFEKAQQQYTEIEKNQMSADRNRDAKRQEKIEKQRRREERARRARERAKRLNSMDNMDLDFELEKDESFNADDDADSWLGDTESYKGTNSAANSAAFSEERIYSGRSSPMKKFNPNNNNIDRYASASTVDSYDATLVRSAPSSGYASEHPISRDKDQDKDEFFDS